MRFAAKAEIEPRSTSRGSSSAAKKCSTSGRRAKRWRGASSSAGGSSRASHAGAERSTTASCPAEAGLDETHISFSKGCYPGQEPIARQRYRGKVNRKLRVLEIEGEAQPDDELVLDGKKVGRITSAVPGLALGLCASRSPGRCRN